MDRVNSALTELLRVLEVWWIRSCIIICYPVIVSIMLGIGWEEIRFGISQDFHPIVAMGPGLTSKTGFVDEGITKQNMLGYRFRFSRVQVFLAIFVGLFFRQCRLLYLKIIELKIFSFSIKLTTIGDSSLAFLAYNSLFYIVVCFMVLKRGGGATMQSSTLFFKFKNVRSE